ncbi:MAG: CHAD domain-containing protein [Melioribacteraceae bacterium]|nr:CHAD domain-containing protein [Melioribacteraceae bacterium]MCF8354912.1 CHAD domain-containing protein [Melioribacteraceae bacterium]MCF8395237.1 CHAD domain-containing protein [Melioribacteraceae bacterium]MCF8420717.1 CHAD domain-containing protein [Melioribacteraceae bacterium]
MAFKLQKRESVAQGIKRIILEQIHNSMKLAKRPGSNPNKSIHEIRKSYKRIRAVLRLVRDEIGREIYKTENVRYRDAGRLLSDIRDSFVLVETLDLIRKEFRIKKSDWQYSALSEKLTARHHDILSQKVEDENVLAAVFEIMDNGKQHIYELPINNDDFSALSGGLLRVYSRGVSKLAVTFSDPHIDTFHDWRKRVKYLWYHSNILMPMNYRVMKRLEQKLDMLSDHLGHEHDFAVLLMFIESNPSYLDNEEQFKTLIGMVNKLRFDMRAKAWQLGEKIYNEEPAAFIDKLNGYWVKWKS